MIGIRRQIAFVFSLLVLSVLPVSATDAAKEPACGARDPVEEFRE